MAIPGIPSSFNVQTANQQIYASWDIAAGATSYDVQRSTDGVSFASVATVTTNGYLDIAVSLGVQYWYKVASINGSGTSPYTLPQSAVPVPNGEYSLGQIRLQAQQRADRVNSEFVTMTEWNTYINQSLFELYDLLIGAYDEDYFVASPAQFVTNGNQQLYPLPNGVLSFTDLSNQSFVAPALYKLLGVDLGVNNANNGWVSVKKFNFMDRNKYFYPNTAATIYGVFNLSYRILGNNLELIPTPSSNQPIRLWYIPRMTMLLKDTDTTTAGISGWIEYVIVDAAIKALQKEESDVSVLMAQKAALIQRIQAMALNRDAGQADTITDSRGSGWNTDGSGFRGGGW